MAKGTYIRDMAKGGAQPGAGRKPVDEKAVAISIYEKPSVIEEKGGKEAVQQVMKEAVRNMPSVKIKKRKNAR